MYLSNTPSCGRRGQVREQGATVQCRLRAEIPFKSLTNICSTLGETTTFATFATVTTLSNFKASKPNLFRVFLIVVPFQQRKKKEKEKERENVEENFPEFCWRNSILDVDHFGEREIGNGNGNGRIRASVFRTRDGRRCEDLAR